MDIIVDTREQLPLWQRGCIKFCLVAGDYTTMKLRNHFAIERKSLQDLYGTITKGHVRFRNELIRAQVNGIKLAVFVEGSRKRFITKQFPGGSRRQTKGETLDKIMKTVETRYGIEVVWCASRADCRNKIRERLIKEERRWKKQQ